MCPYHGCVTQGVCQIMRVPLLLAVESHCFSIQYFYKERDQIVEICNHED